MCLTLMMMMILKSFSLVQLSKAKREQVISRELVLKLFEYKCVLEVRVHIHPILIKIHPVFNFKSLFKNPLSQISLFWDSCQKDVALYRPLPH